MPEEPVRRLSEVLREEYVRLHGDLPAATVKALTAADQARDTAIAAVKGDKAAVAAATEAAENVAEAEKLKAIYAAIHEWNKDATKARTALCFSGGGIRSATFALGIMQRLASFGLLSKFDYVSTVSGGGFIGSWLSSFIRRTAGGIRQVERDLTDVQRPINNLPPRSRDPLAPEIEPLRWLRRFSNYLTPKLGLMSADTWAFIGSYLRNLVLVWLIFVPFLAALLAVPRLAIGLLRLQASQDLTTITPMEFLALGLIGLGTGVIAWTRPVSYRQEGWLTNGKFIRWILVPYFFGALLLVVSWASRWVPNPNFGNWWRYVLPAFILINVVSSGVYMWRYFREMKRQRPRKAGPDEGRYRYALKKLLGETVAAAVAGAVGAVLLYAAVAKLFNDPRARVEPLTEKAWQALPPMLGNADAEVYLCFALPLVLGILFVQSALFVGLSSWFNEEYDREWWGRAAGWVLFAGVAWIVVTVIAIYGPVGIYFAPRMYAALTAGTGLAAILIGKSGLTGATDREKDEKAGAAQTGTNIGLGIVGPLFAIGILALISLCTSRILVAIDPPDRIRSGVLALRAAGTYQIREDKPFPVEAGDTGKSVNFETSRFPAVDETHIAATEHLWSVDQTDWQEGLGLILGLVLFSLFISFCIGANQFSMHGLYRNRLIRGYLGASRDDRRPNRFSGFDPTDNPQMDRLRPEMFWRSTFKDVMSDGSTIADPSQWPFPSGTKINTANLKFSDETKNALKEAKENPNDTVLVQAAGDLLAEDLNHIIDDPEVVLASAGQGPQSVANRLALQELFPKAFQPMSNHARPMHVVNTTLNLVAGNNLAWQERKAAPFAISPLYSGSPRLGYRRSRVYGGPSGVSLGTAVAISGAAASPNMGYNSSPALSFLLTLFNVRLGWWLGNPKKPAYVKDNPSNTLKTILDEAFGLTDDTHDYVYLSDGAHFDNLGLYEMVLRRCHCIVVSDAGADPEFGFDDLGNAIRKVRIDLGIEIEITGMGLFPRSDQTDSSPRKYCAVAKIRYSQIDGPGAADGCLLYLKPAFYGKTEPKDVYNYGTTYQAFPHQSTGDQWFSESQFESYRQLGYFASREVANRKDNFDTVCELIAAAKDYLDDKPVGTTKGCESV